MESTSVVRIDHYWDKVLQLKHSLGRERFCVLTKVIKCAICLSHGNADTERSLSVKKKTLTKGRTKLSIVTLNGLRTTEDGIKNMGGLSNVTVRKDMLSSVKGSHKVYLEHIDIEKKKEESKRKEKHLPQRDQRKRKK